MRPAYQFFLPLLLTLLASLAGCQRASEPATEVRTVLVHIATDAPSKGGVLTGEIRARHEMDLAFRVGGKIVARLADTGSEIRAGQPLARLDPADLQLAATAAAAQLAAAESEVTTTTAERDRYADLLSRKFVSQAAFDTRQHALNSALARREQAQAQLRISRNQADYGTLSSDYPAVISAVLADAGQVVAPGQAVFRVARPDELEIQVAVPESRLDEIRKAPNFAVNLWIDPKIKITGQLRELGAVADPVTRSYPARIRLIDPPPDVRLGMSARVTPNLAGQSAETAVLVPRSALGDQGKGPFVWVVQSDKVAQRPVQIAQFREDGVSLAAGLQAGEAVVVAGLAQLTAGQSVRAKVAPAPAEQR